MAAYYSRVAEVNTIPTPDASDERPPRGPSRCQAEDQTLYAKAPAQILRSVSGPAKPTLAYHRVQHGATFRYIACLYIQRALSRARRPRTLPCAPRAPVHPQCNPHSCLAPRTELHAPPRSAAVVYYPTALAHFLFETLLWPCAYPPYKSN
jgi:hypothetical protein